MKILSITLCMIAISCSALNALKPSGKAVQLKDISKYSILIPDKPTSQERFAAEKLAEYLGKIFSVNLKIQSNEQKPFISVGKTMAARKSGLFNKLAPQSYSLKIKNDNLYIRGGNPGPLNGVIALLEEDFGCRWYTPEENSKALKEPALIKVSQLKSNEFKVVPRNFTPPFEMREFMCDYYPAKAPVNWTLMNRFAPISFHCIFPDETGAQLASGYFIHTYRDLLPSKKFYASHPEYYALQQGKRVKLTAFSGSVCYTNPEVPKLMADKILKLLKQKPDQRIFSVSAPDSSDVACECSRCSSMIKKEKLSGAQINLANKVAEIVSEKYPDVRITCLAYGIEPPKTVKLHPNLIIFFAPIAERNNSQANILPLSKIYKLKTQLKHWLRLKGKLYFWDYIANYKNLVPNPTIDAFAQSVRFLASRGVKGYFADCSSPNISLARLKLWVYSKLIWNPDLNVNSLIAEFLPGYYGKAAPDMARYVAIQRNAWKRFIKKYMIKRDGVNFKFNNKELAAMRKCLTLAAAKAETEAIRARIARETLTLYTLTLKGNPKVTGIKQYEKDYKSAETLLKYLSPRADIFRLGYNKRWKKKLAWAKSPAQKNQYSPNTVSVSKAVTYEGMAERMKDKKALTGFAVRHKGGKPWGTQYSYGTFKDFLVPGKTYIIRLRVRPEVKGNVPQAIFTFGAFQHNNEKLNSSQKNLVGKWHGTNVKAYKWLTIGKLKFNNEDATGMFWINSLVKPEEAIWYDTLEFVPIEEYKGAIPKNTIII